MHASRDAIDWLMESHMIWGVSEVLADDEQIKDNDQYYFGDMGINYYFMLNRYSFRDN